MGLLAKGRDKLISAENNKLLKGLENPETLTHPQRAKIAHDRKVERRNRGEFTVKESRIVKKMMKKRRKEAGASK